LTCVVTLGRYGADSASPGGLTPQARIIDIKGMRKIEELGDTLRVYIGASPTNAAAVSVTHHISIGLKLA
jgi:hypothetical protein